MKAQENNMHPVPMKAANRTSRAQVKLAVLSTTWRLRWTARAMALWIVWTALMGFACLAQAAQTVTYYYTDPQGTVLATTDAAGNILAPADYRPYGTQALGTPEAALGYTGHVNDPDSGLVYMQARYYDPSIGKFLSTDPNLGTAGDLFSQSRYAYASNNPVGRVDLDGRESACVSQASHCGNIGEGIAYLPGDAADRVDTINNDYVTPIVAANPAAFGEFSASLEGLSGLLRAVSVARTAEAVIGGSEVPIATSEALRGEFSVINWAGYPEGIPKPTGTLRVIGGEEYKAARSAANTANRVIRKEQGLTGQAVDIHEVTPVKFGGSPTDPANKIILPRDVHQQQVTPWWSQFQKDVGG